jgi:hypothetical protein
VGSFQKYLKVTFFDIDGDFYMLYYCAYNVRKPHIK